MGLLSLPPPAERRSGFCLGAAWKPSRSARGGKEFRKKNIPISGSRSASQPPFPNRRPSQGCQASIPRRCAGDPGSPPGRGAQQREVVSRAQMGGAGSSPGEQEGTAVTPGHGGSGVGAGRR